MAELNILYTIDNVSYLIISLESKEVQIAIFNDQSFSGEYTIPKTVEIEENSYEIVSIGAGAFAECQNLTKIIFNEDSKIKTIEEQAFKKCKSLQSIEIPDTVTDLGKEAFYECASLGQIVLGKNITKINDYTFYECSALTKVSINNPSFNAIGKYAFYKCNNLSFLGEKEEFHFESLSELGDCAFEGCTKLKNFYCDSGEFLMGKHVFASCSQLEEVKIPGRIQVTKENYSFNDCSSLKTATVPGCLVNYLPRRVVTTLTVNGGIIPKKAMDSYGWVEDAVLEKLTITNQVIEVGENAFRQAKYLRTLIIEPGILSLKWNVGGNGVFNLGDWSAGNITEADVPWNLYHTFPKASLKKLTVREGRSLEGLTGQVLGTIPGPEYANMANKNATSLCQVTIGKGIEKIAAGAFFGLTLYNTDGVTPKIEFEDPENSNIIEIGNSAFANIRCLGDGNENEYDFLQTELELPHRLKILGSTVFATWNNLTTLKAECPKLEIIGDYPFSLRKDDPTNITSFTGNGLLLSKLSFDNLSTINITCGKILPNQFEEKNLSNKTFSISGITEIGDSAFKRATFYMNLREENGSVYDILDFSKSPSLSVIGEYAFEGLISMTSQDSGWTWSSEKFFLKFANNAVLQKIGKGAFKNSHMAGWIETFPNKVTILEEEVFYNCPLSGSLAFNSVENVETWAFYNINHGYDITKISLPNVKKINSNAFTYLEPKEGFDFYDENGKTQLEDISENAFSDTDGYSEIKLPYIHENGFIKFFGGLPSNLRNVTITGGNIPDNAFSELGQLEEINLSQLTCKSVGAAAFQGCSYLTSLTLPSTLTSIGANAFNNCGTSNNTLTIPDTVRSFGEDCFKNIKFKISFFGREGNLDNSSPYNEEKLKQWMTIHFANENATPMSQWGNLPNCLFEETNKIIIPILEKDKAITEIKQFAFYNGKNLKDIHIPHSVTIIGEGAFKNTDLTEIEISRNIKTLHPDAFGSESLEKVSGPSIILRLNGWDNANLTFEVTSGDLTEEIASSGLNDKLKHLIIGNYVKKIDLGAFNSLTNLPALTIPFIGTSREDTEHTLLSFFGEGLKGNLRTLKVTDALIIPAAAAAGFENLFEVDFSECSKLTEIGSNAFNSCSSLQSILFCNSIQTLGEGAFSGAISSDLTIRRLVILTLPKYLTTIGDSCFAGCSKLYYVDFSNCVQLSAIGMSAFNSCYSLVEINMPDTVTTLGEGCFANCSTLSSVTLSKNLDELPEGAFVYNHKLTEIIIPDKIQTIYMNCFFGCYTLKKVIFDEFNSKLKTIGSNSFSCCYELAMINLPNSLEMIGDTAFQGCGFEYLVIPNSVTSIGAAVLSNNDNLIKLTFPIPNNFTNLKYLFYNPINNTNKTYLNTLTISAGVLPTGGIEASWTITNLNLESGMSSIAQNSICGFIENLYYNIPEAEALTWGCLNTDTGKIYAITIGKKVISLPDNLFVEAGIGRAIKILQFETDSVLRKIGNYTFSYIMPEDLSFTTKKSIILPDTVEEIGEGAFSNNEGLGEIILSKSLTTLGAAALQNCFTLEEIRIPRYVREVNENTFQNCSSLKTIIFEGGSECEGINISAFNGTTSLEKIYLNTIKLNKFTPLSATTNENLKAYYSDTRAIFDTIQNKEALETIASVYCIDEEDYPTDDTNATQVSDYKYTVYKWDPVRSLYVDQPDWEYCQVKTDDWRTELYYKGIEEQQKTFFKNYYAAELNSEWPKIYDIKASENKDDSKVVEGTQVKSYSGDYRETNKLDYDYWLDFIEGNANGVNQNVSQYKVDNIGRRTKVSTDGSINCLFEEDIPDNILIEADGDVSKEVETVENNGQTALLVSSDIYKHLATGGGQNAAFNMVKELLLNHTQYNEAINLSTIPIYHLEPNSRISIFDSEMGVYGDYMIKSMSLPLTSNGTSSISATKCVEKNI